MFIQNPQVFVNDAASRRVYGAFSASNRGMEHEAPDP